MKTGSEETGETLRQQEIRHDEELRQFAYTVTHDLREPLRMIGSYSQLLSRRYIDRLDSEGREFLDFINNGVQRMDSMLRDLLAYSHHSQALDHPLSSVSPEAALQGVLLALEKQIRETCAQITHDPLPEVMFDFNELTQVFRQLLSNSLKFHGAAAPQIHVSAESTDETVTFSVRDNGIGIDPRYHHQIFGLFKRLHRDEYPGTGMGLAIAQRIVTLRGGRIWLESEAGSGAIFRFTIPN